MERKSSSTRTSTSSSSVNKAEELFDAHQSFPSDVHRKEDLNVLNEAFLNFDSDSGELNEKRPLKNVDIADGSTHFYALKPLFFSVFLILVVEGMERFSWMTVVTQLPYLEGQYSPEWNAGMTPTEAGSLKSTEFAIAFAAPFLGGIVADGWLGDFWGILLGTSLFYIPGLILQSLTTFPGVLGSEFNVTAARAAMLGLIPIGAGFIKSLVNVFGAKQYHPVLQQKQVESYYIKFYMFIVGGALVGGIVLPIVAQYNIYACYLLPPVMMTLALILFVSGSSRYVKPKPNKKDLWTTLSILGQASVFYKSMDKQKVSQGGTHRDSFVDGIKQFLYVIPITALTIPFNVAYTQLTGQIITQGQAMQPAGFLDAAVMNNCEALSVLLFGFFFDAYLNPLMKRHGIHLSICHKFAIGSFCGFMSMAVAALIDYGIHANLEKGQLISVGYQAFIYIFMGAGEIFVYAMAYEAAFEVAPKEHKGLASAFNLFLIGSVPGFIETALQNALTDWLPTCQASGQGVDAVVACYGASNMSAFFWVAAGISGFGVLLTILPFVNQWVEGVHKKAVENNKRSAMEARGALMPMVAGTATGAGHWAKERALKDDPTLNLASRGPEVIIGDSPTFV